MVTSCISVGDEQGSFASISISVGDEQQGDAKQGVPAAALAAVRGLEIAIAATSWRASYHRLHLFLLGARLERDVDDASID